MKMVYEQRLQLKMKFLFGYNMKSVIWLSGDKNLVGSIFPGGGQWTNLQLMGGLPTIPPVAKTLYPAIT